MGSRPLSRSRVRPHFLLLAPSLAPPSGSAQARQSPASLQVSSSPRPGAAPAAGQGELRPHWGLLVFSLTNSFWAGDPEGAGRALGLAPKPPHSLGPQALHNRGAGASAESQEVWERAPKAL